MKTILFSFAFVCIITTSAWAMEYDERISACVRAEIQDYIVKHTSLCDTRWSRECDLQVIGGNPKYYGNQLDDSSPIKFELIDPSDEAEEYYGHFPIFYVGKASVSIKAVKDLKTDKILKYECSIRNKEKFNQDKLPKMIVNDSVNGPCQSLVTSTQIVIRKSTGSNDIVHSGSFSEMKQTSNRLGCIGRRILNSISTERDYLIEKEQKIFSRIQHIVHPE